MAKSNAAVEEIREELEASRAQTLDELVEIANVSKDRRVTVTMAQLERLRKVTHDDECLKEARHEGWKEGYGDGIQWTLIAIDSISDRAYRAGVEDGRNEEGHA